MKEYWFTPDVQHEPRHSETEHESAEQTVIANLRKAWPQLDCRTAASD